MQNEMIYTVYVSGVANGIRAKNRFHALNRAKQLFPFSKITMPISRTNASRIETSNRSNGRSFSVMVRADGTTWDLD